MLHLYQLALSLPNNPRGKNNTDILNFTEKVDQGIPK